MKLILTILLATICVLFAKEHQKNIELSNKINVKKSQIICAFKAGYFTRQESLNIPIDYAWPHDSNKFNQFASKYLK